MEAKKDYMEFKLTEQELEERKEQLLNELDNNDRITQESSDSAAQFKSQLKTSDTKIIKLRNSIKDERELFQVEIFFNEPKDGKKTIKRMDSGKKIVTDMTTEEMEEYSQKELDL